MSEFQKYLDDVLANIKIDNTPDATNLDYDILKEVRDLLINTRKEQDISQKTLSQKTGIPQSNISKFETGYNVPSIQILKRIADGLGKRLIIDFVEAEDGEE